MIPPAKQLGSVDAGYEMFDDEDPTEICLYGMNDRPYQPTYHTSKFNKKVFPGGFQLNLGRSQKFSHRNDSKSSGSYLNLGSLNQPSTATSSTNSPPRISFMFWAKGLIPESPSKFDHRRVTISEAIKSTSCSSGLHLHPLRYRVICSNFRAIYPLLLYSTTVVFLMLYRCSGHLRKLDKGLNRTNKPTVRQILSPAHGMKMSLDTDFDEWPQAQIIVEEMRCIDNSCRSHWHQHTFSETDSVTSRSYPRKVLLDTGLRHHSINNSTHEEPAYSSSKLRRLNCLNKRDCESRPLLIDIEPQLDLGLLSQQSHSSTHTELPHQNLSAYSPISSKLQLFAVDDPQMLAYETKPTSGYDNYNERFPWSNTDTGIRFCDTIGNMMPLPGRILVKVFRYKAMLNSISSTILDKPALMLDIRADVKYADIMTIISEFFASTQKTISVQGLLLDTPQLGSTSTPSLSTIKSKGSLNKAINTERGGNNANNMEHVVTMSCSSMEVYYLNIELNVWRLVNDKSAWSAAVLLSLENNQSLRITVSRNHEEESREIFGSKNPPKGMSHAHLVTLTKSMGDSRNLISGASNNGYNNEGSSRQLSNFYYLLDKQKPKKSLLLMDNNEYDSSPFTITKKSKHKNTVTPSPKCRRIGNICSVKKEYSYSGENFFMPKNFGGFLLSKKKLKGEIKHPEKSRALSTRVLCKSYTQPYVSISNDSIDLINLNINKNCNLESSIY